MGGPWLKYFKRETMEEMNMLAKRHPEVAGAVRQIRRISPIRAIRRMIFKYEDGRHIQAGQEKYAREQGYNQAKTEEKSD
jgi:hypothetical protein